MSQKELVISAIVLLKTIMIAKKNLILLNIYKSIQICTIIIMNSTCTSNKRKDSTLLVNIFNTNKEILNTLLSVLLSISLGNSLIISFKN